MSKPDSWMPFYWSDFLVDTTHLDEAQTGAYALLLGHAWMRSGSLPDDDDQLARFARCTKNRWKKHREIVAKFFEIGDGVWRQKRLSSEFQKASHRYDTKVENGKKGGRPRKTDRVTETKPTGLANDNRPGNRNETQPQPQPQHQKATSKTTRATTGALLPPDPPAGVLPDVWNAWVKAKGKKQTESADRIQRKHLAEWQAQGQDPNAIVEKAVASGWAGLFPSDKPNARAPPNGSNGGTQANRRTANIDRLTGQDRTQRNERFAGTAERMDRTAVPSVPSDLREPPDDDVR